MRKIIIVLSILLLSTGSTAVRAQPDAGNDPMEMTGMYGSYPMTREASGTSWQPDSTPHQGLHLMKDDWMIMIHGYADGIYDDQGGPRGGDKAFSESMLMLMGQRPWGPGTLG